MRGGRPRLPQLPEPSLCPGLPEHHIGGQTVSEGDMPGSEVLQQRIEELISQANDLISLREPSLQKAWLAAAPNPVEMRFAQAPVLTAFRPNAFSNSRQPPT